MCTYFIDIIIFTVYFVSFIYTKQTVKTKKTIKYIILLQGICHSVLKTLLLNFTDTSDCMV